MKSSAQSVEAYLAELPPERRAALQTLRELIRETLPAAAETMRYGMAAYERDGAVICGLASQRRHMALYVCDGPIARHKARLGKLDCGKGCIRFKRLDQLPMAVIRDILAELR